jgi:polysaccharide export outer membrane protein
MNQDVQPANLPQLVVGSNDLLNIAVYDSPEFSGTSRVDTNGDIKLPMLEQALHVAGLLPAQIEGVLGKALEQAQLVVKPVVGVTVAEYQSRAIVVSGAVHKPTSFQAFGEVTLLDAITHAEGLSDLAGPEILIETKSSHGSPALTQRVSTQALLNSPLGNNNIVLHGGEQIRIPEQGKIAVIGSVKHPGIFSIRDSQDASVLRLLARSEGLAPNASADAYIFHDANKSHENLQNRIDVHRILTQKSPDIQLQEGDVLYIPDNTSRRVTLSILEHLMTAGAMTSSAFIYASAH